MTAAEAASALNEQSNRTSTTATISSYPSISIVGAGIAGLSLACHLRRRRISFTIFDAASKPKGHNYGITISPWAYQNLLPAIEPEQSIQSFRKHIAVDRLIDGQGGTTASTNVNNENDDVRASDMALRELLSRGHDINWNHKVVSFDRTPDGSRLTFENGKTSVARLVVDAGGERSGLTKLLLPDLKPEILPYAVYHGTRYVSWSTFHQDFASVFRVGENVRYFPPTRPSASSPPTKWHLQIAKSYITHSDLPCKIKSDHTVTRDQNQEDDDPIVEFRYTFSRPSLTSTNSNPTREDSLYTPDRSAESATETPPEFLEEISRYLHSSSPSSSSSSNLPAPLQKILSPDRLAKDRILNWLMRVKPLPTQPEFLRSLARNNVVVVGDSAHSTPPVMSEGAGMAMADAERLAVWIKESHSRRSGGGGGGGEETNVGEDVQTFYDLVREDWVGIAVAARRRLREIHLSVHEREGSHGKLGGRI